MHTRAWSIRARCCPSRQMRMRCRKSRSKALNAGSHTIASAHPDVPGAVCYGYGCSCHYGYGYSAHSSRRFMHGTFMLGIRPSSTMGATPPVAATNRSTAAGISHPLRADMAESILAAFRGRAISFSRNQQVLLRRGMMCKQSASSPRVCSPSRISYGSVIPSLHRHVQIWSARNVGGRQVCLP